MNRIAKLFCWLAAGEMTAVAIAALAARWPDVAHHPETINLLGWRILIVLAVFPALATYGVVRTERRLRPEGMELSMAHRRMTEWGMAVNCVLFAGMHNWFAAIFATRQMLLFNNASPQSVGLLIGGALLVVYGNASAKLAPPKGPAAPDPGAWIRTSLRNGWAVVAVGMIMMIAAFATVGWRIAATVAILPIMLVTVQSQRRLLRGEPGPNARLT